MNKRTRFVILLAVLAVCFAFLWPSISWYYGTPKEMKALALGSLQSIKDYATVKASDDVKAFTDAARKDPNAQLDESYGWIKKIVARNYKNMGAKVPSPLTKSAVLNAFSSEQEFREAVQARYRDAILKAKKQYQNSVKLGLDLSGGMNIIVKADLDAAVKNQEGADPAESSATLKANAMHVPLRDRRVWEWTRGRQALLVAPLPLVRPRRSVRGRGTRLPRPSGQARQGRQSPA